MQPARADVLGVFVDMKCHLSEATYAVFPEIERDLLGVEQRRVLRRQRRVGLGQDAHEVVGRQRLQLHADREPALQLGNQVGRLGDMERAGRDEQDVIGLHHAVLGVDRGALDQRQQVSLHAFAGHIGTLGAGAPRDLVDLVEKHDALLFGGFERLRLQLFFVEHLRRFLVGQQAKGFTNLELACLPAIAAEILEHALQLARHLLHARRRHDLDANGHRLDVDLDFLVVELTFTQPLSEFLAGVAVRRRRFGLLREADARPCGRQQHVENALLGRILGAMADLRHGVFAGHLDRHVDQVAHDAVDLAADVADLGKLGGFDLDEGCFGQPREAPRDLGLADAGRTDHQDVLGRDFAAQRLVDLDAPPAIAQGDGHRALGLVLADDVLVQFLDDFSWCHLRHTFFLLSRRSAPQRATIRRGLTAAALLRALGRAPTTGRRFASHPEGTWHPDGT